MPQLWTETIVTQYFWLVVILLGFYYVAVSQIIPQIAYTLKTRKELETSGPVITKNTGNTVNIDNSKSLLSNLLAIPSTQGRSKELDNVVEGNLSTIYGIKTEWVKKYSN